MTEPLRVALVCPYDLDRPGGVQSHVRGLARALRERGHHAVIVGPGQGSTTDGADEMRVGRFVTMGLSGTQIDVGVVTRAEMHRVRDARFDVVHLHTPWNPFVGLQLWWATPDAAHVATFHDAPPEGLWGALAARVLMPLAGHLLSLALDGVMAVSSVAARSLPSRRTVIVPNGIDADTLQRESAAAREGVILYVGRLEPRKGVSDLIRAFALLAQEHPGIRLVIAGDGPLAPALRRQAEGRPDIDFVGPVDEARKAALLATCRIFCAPSRHGESFGIVLLEAMACGAPVVAAANHGYRAVLGDTGLLYPPGDVDALRARLSRLLSDESLAHELGARGLERAGAHDWSRLVERVEEVYRQALRSRRRSDSPHAPK